LVAAYRDAPGTPGEDVAMLTEGVTWMRRGLRCV
jgi:hypothetical protein